jgi:1-acylglycerone phosphate reductase
MASQAPATSTKYVLVTGCTSTSLGSAIALAFAKLPSFHVFATARSPSSLSHFTPYLNITTLQLDVTSTASIAAAVELVSLHTNGTLGILVNNAGRGHLGPLLDTDLNEFRELLETNVLGVLAVTQAFAPMLIKGKGQVINVGSVMRSFSIVWQGNAAMLCCA